MDIGRRCKCTMMQAAAWQTSSKLTTISTNIHLFLAHNGLKCTVKQILPPAQTMDKL